MNSVFFCLHLNNVCFKKLFLKTSLVCFSSVFIIFIFVQQVHAHKVNIFAYAEDGMVHAEGYFVDGSKCKDSRVEVFDERSGTKLLEGKTDDNGQYSFKIPDAMPLKLILHAGMGHQNEYILSEAEIKEAIITHGGEKEKNADRKSKRAAEQRLMKSDKIDKIKDREQGPTMQGKSTVDISELEEVLDRVTERKIQPVMRMLASLHESIEKPGVTEIIGGIGYIFGIMGIVMYFRSKVRNRNL